jgi:hypothetical protein
MSQCDIRATLLRESAAATGVNPQLKLIGVVGVLGWFGGWEFGEAILFQSILTYLNK